MSSSQSLVLPARRRFLGLAAGVAAAAHAVAASPSLAQTTTPAGLAATRGLRPFPPTAEPFHGEGRRALAALALDVLRGHSGIGPGRGIYILPPAPVLGSSEAPRRQWSLTLPGGTLIYLIAFADVLGRVDPAQGTVRLDGVPLENLADHVLFGVRAATDGRIRSHAVMDFVFAPPPPGKYKIQVTGQDAAYVSDYDLTIEPPDAFGPLVIRDWLGKTFAMDGHLRRHIPDAETVRLLGYAEEHMLTLQRAALEHLPEGAPLPPLKEGLARAAAGGPTFRLEAGTRRWLRPEAAAGEVRELDAVTLQTIPPATGAMAEGALVKGAAPDVFHVDAAAGGALRKVPSAEWIAQRRATSPVSEQFYVPQRVLDTLPHAAPHGREAGATRRDRHFRSEALGQTVPYRVHLPQDYGAPGMESQRYPVLYLLHGSSGHYEEWSRFGIEAAAGALFNARRLPHAIIVQLQGGKSYWINQPDGARWADYVVKDAISHVDATYRTIPERRARAVGGHSMGGHGALQLSMNFPYAFGVVGAHSPSLHRRETAPQYFGSETDFAQRDPLTLATRVRPEDAPILWIDTGEGDEWRRQTEEVHRLLDQRGWKHEWKLFSGSHGDEYWSAHVTEYLTFYLEAFARSGIAVSPVPPPPAPAAAASATTQPAPAAQPAQPAQPTQPAQSAPSPAPAEAGASPASPAETGQTGETGEATAPAETVDPAAPEENPDATSG